MKPINPPSIGWVIFLDVYGFTDLAERDCKGTIRRLHSCYRDIRRLEWTGQPPKTFTFSDSTYLFYEARGQTHKIRVIEKFVTDIERIMSIFADQCLPLRGGCAYGEVAMSRTSLVGEPLARAYRYEGMVPAPLVLLPQQEVMNRRRPDYLHYAAPKMTKVHLKGGGIMNGKLIHPFPLDGFVKLVQQQLKRCSIWGPPSVAQAWLDAWDYLTTHFADR